jgi:hypothetical protein
VWALQLVTWCAIIVATKVAIALIMVAGWGGINSVADALHHIFRHHRKVQLILVSQWSRFRVCLGELASSIGKPRGLE